MAKRTISTNFKINSKDETGAFVNLDYTCPYCHYDNYEMIFIGAGNLEKISNDFETDLVCKECGEDVIVECR